MVKRVLINTLIVSGAAVAGVVLGSVLGLVVGAVLGLVVGFFYEAQGWSSNESAMGSIFGTLVGAPAGLVVGLALAVRHLRRMSREAGIGG
jgi:hypothetical protein